MEKRKKKKVNITINGTIFTTGRGVGYLSHPDFKEDIEISPDNLNTALHGDSVTAIILPKRKGDRRIQGEVTKIDKRARKEFVGTVEKENGVFTFVADDKRVYTSFIIPNPPQTLEENYKVLAKFISWENSKKPPRVEILEIIGKKGVHEVEMRSILYDKGIVYDFPPEVEGEAQEIEVRAGKNFENEIKNRKDMRGVTTFTIDPKTAKDFDDALSYKKLSNGHFEIGIHIADVSHYVEPKTAMDREARKRGFSVYLVDRTIPMLPEILSNGLCSLNPDEDKLAFSALFEIDEAGRTHSRWFGKTVIHSNRRFTYEDAEESIKGGGDYTHELKTLNSIAKKLREERFSKGAIDFSDDEVSFTLDEKGAVLSIEKKIRLDTHKLVEEFMLLANREVATEIDRLTKKHGHEHLFIYRVHDLPDREKLEELGIFLRAIGYEFYLDKEINPKAINALLEKARGKAEEGIVSSSILRSMAKAAYSTKVKGHFGLAFEYYTHFTSPIRRYPDLLAHRLLHQHLSKKTIPNQDFNFYIKASSDLSEKEIQVMEAERESIKFKQVEYMSFHIGEEFIGVVNGISEHGFYIEEKSTKASGMVNVRTLKDDFYILDQKNYALVGREKNKKYTIGDEVKVKLLRADIDRRQLDFELVK